MTLKILLLENIHPITQKTLSDYFKTEDNLQITSLKHTLPEEELLLELRQYDIVGIRSKTQITKNVLTMNTHLKMICCFCIGTNQVDLETAQQLNIPVFNSPYMNTRSVAELVVCHIIALARQTYQRNKEMHRAHWNKTSKNCHEVRGKTLGIIGYGHVGSQVSTLAESLGMNVIFYDIAPVLPRGNSQPISSINQLVEMSDFVTLHVPLSEETDQLIGAEELSHFKQGSYLINTSRGNVVDLDALQKYLDQGLIAGCALDVYPQEPKGNKCDWTMCLQGYPNVILTPHIGGATEEAQSQIAIDMSMKIFHYVSYGSTQGVVNLPEIVSNAKFKNGGVIIANFHKNISGYLSKINNVFQEQNINIDKQILSTYQSRGYLLIKTSKPKNEAENNNFQKLISHLVNLNNDTKTIIIH